MRLPTVETRATIGIGSSGSWYKGTFSGNGDERGAIAHTNRARPVTIPLGFVLFFVRALALIAGLNFAGTPGT
jgi:hypothetical protein